MPTPVQHLVLAQRLLDDASLPAAVRDRLRAQRSAFFFGNTAPDVQTVSGQLREETHFFVIPWAQVPLPHNALFSLYPELRHPRSLSTDHAAFIAGYICHLWLDVVWVRDIYLNGFGPHAHWGANLRERHVYHNILRAWCDRHDQQQLTGTIDSALALAEPIDWLPFTADRYLIQWRDNLAEQFRPGGSIRTVEVFAGRGGVPPEKFHQVLDSPDEMDRHIFAHAPREKIEKFYQVGYEQMAELIVEYFHTV
ncbi:MAG TPA: zinc dependent phospholipase C family protein [Anaerolineae bacterium]|nr:zinc dependent phospholipase C family protein [Anaerolineae bacterium]